MSCTHISCDKEWLPAANGLLGLHPYCMRCGAVKNVSSDRGRKLGYFANAIHNLKNHLSRRNFKISQAQIRLIMKEFIDGGFDDVYSVSFSIQKKAFIQIVKKYIRVSEETVGCFV